MTGESPEPQEKPLLLFQWGHQDKRFFPLLFWLLLSGAVLTAFYLIFQLRSAVQAQRPASSHSIVLLLPSLPASQQLIEVAADQSHLALGSGLATTMERELAAPKLPRLRPSFADFSVGLRVRLQDQPLQREFPQIVSTARVLPPHPKAPEKPPSNQPAPVSELRWQVTSQPLVNRPISAQPKLGARLGASTLDIEFAAAIDEHGRVRFALPQGLDTSIPSEEVARLRLSLNELRFAPASGAEWQWGTLSLSSGGASAP